MKCLFVRHPFAGWICDRVKVIEYRTRSTRVRGRIGIIQSRTGTIIGDVEITGCTYNEELDYYEWHLEHGRRYRKPVPFQGKSGAVVWIDIDYNPDAQEIMRPLSNAEFERQTAAYEKELEKFLHPKLICTVVLKDGRRITFPEGTDDAYLEQYESNHAAEIDHWETEYAEE